MRQFRIREEGKDGTRAKDVPPASYEENPGTLARKMKSPKSVAFESLKQRWKSQGLQLAPGAKPQEIRLFDEKYEVVLPNDFRDYFLNVNGMLQKANNECDAQGFGFWPLARVKSIVEEFAGVRPVPPGLQDTDKHFVFADYLQWSWAYAIRLSNVPSEPNLIIDVGTLHPRVVAPSFTSFVDLYLRDARETYPD